jgi:hypothetical protein
MLRGITCMAMLNKEKPWYFYVVPIYSANIQILQQHSGFILYFSLIGTILSLKDIGEHLEFRTLKSLGIDSAVTALSSESVNF